MEENKEKVAKAGKNRASAKEIFKSAIPFIIFAVIMAIITVLLWDEIIALGTVEGRARFKEYIDSIGIGGWFITLGIQLLQIFVAFIPGEPVELMLGFVWGPWLGMLTCLIGIFIGTFVIFLLVKKFGRPFVQKIVGDKDLTTYKFLSDPKKIDITVFVLFFIPGTPKDALTYIAPLAPISPVRYLLIATFARIPSIITSTLLGDSIATGDYLLAIIVFVITAVISIAGIIIGNKFVEKRKAKEAEKDTEYIEETQTNNT